MKCQHPGVCDNCYDELELWEDELWEDDDDEDVTHDERLCDGCLRDLSQEITDREDERD